MARKKTIEKIIGKEKGGKEEMDGGEIIDMEVVEEEGGEEGETPEVVFEPEEDEKRKGKTGRKSMGELITQMEEGEIMIEEEEETEKEEGKLSPDIKKLLKRKARGKTPAVASAEEIEKKSVVSVAEKPVPGEEPAPEEKKLTPEEIEQLAREKIEEREEGILMGNIEELIGEGLKIPESIRKDVTKVLEEEKKKLISEFRDVLSLYKPVSDEIEKMGLMPVDLGDSFVLALFNQIKSEKLESILEAAKKSGIFSSDKIEKLERLKVLPILLLDWENPNPTLESRFLALYCLNERTRELTEELNSIEEKDLTQKEKEERKKLINEDLEKLPKIKEELANKASGRNLRIEAERKIEKEQGPLQPKEEYVKKEKEQYETEKAGWFDEKIRIMRKETAKEMKKRLVKIKILKAKDYHEEERGEMIKEIEEESKKNRTLGTFNKKDADKFFKEKEKEAENRWEELNQERKKEIDKTVEEKIKILGQSSERAEGGITGIYSRIKKELIEDYKKYFEKKPAGEVGSAIRPPVWEEKTREIEKTKCPVVSKEQWEKEPLCPVVKLFGDFIKFIGKSPGLSQEEVAKKFIEEARKGGGYDLGFLEDLKGILVWLMKLIPLTYWKSVTSIITYLMRQAGIKTEGKKER